MLDRFANGALQTGRFIGSLSMDVVEACNTDEIATLGLEDCVFEIEVHQVPRKVLSITSPDGREILSVEALGYSIDES